jgi:hypothetical protein
MKAIEICCIANSFRDRQSALRFELFPYCPPEPRDVPKGTKEDCKLSKRRLQGMLSKVKYINKYRG